MSVDPNDEARRAFGDAAPSPWPEAPSTPVEHAPALPGPRDVPTRQLADWWTRAGAFVLDQLIIAGVAIVAALIAAAIANDAGGDAAEIVTYAIVIPLGLVYAPVLMAREGDRNGQTLGKQIVGIRVVRTNGERVTFWEGVLRTVVAQQLLIAVTFYVYALVDYLWPLRDPQNQALHDKIAKTWVVRTAPAAAAPPGTDDRSVQGGWLPPQAPPR